jgi:hypothetical protein
MRIEASGKWSVIMSKTNKNRTEHTFLNEREARGGEENDNASPFQIDAFIGHVERTVDLLLW